MQRLLGGVRLREVEEAEEQVAHFCGLGTQQQGSDLGISRSWMVKEMRTMEKKEGVRWVNKGGGDGWKSKSTSLKPWARMRPVVPDGMEVRSGFLLLGTS